MSAEEEKILREFIEFILSQKPEFAAEALRPSYMAWVRDFIESKKKPAL